MTSEDTQVNIIVKKVDTIIADLNELQTSKGDDINRLKKKVNTSLEELQSILNPEKSRNKLIGSVKTFGKKVLSKLTEPKAVKSGGGKQRGGFQAAEADETVSVNPNAIDVTSIYAAGNLTASDPISNATNGTDVTLTTPDSFSSGSYIDNNAVPSEISKYVLPSLGVTAGGGRRIRKKKM